MTMLVVALLNGRTKDEWRTWVTDRVKDRVGHETPDALPQLYSQSRLTAFKAKRAAEEARGKAGQTGSDRNPANLLIGFLRQQQERDSDSDDSDDTDEFPSRFGRNSPVTNSLTKLQLNGEAGRSDGLGLDIDEDMGSDAFITEPHETPTQPKPSQNGTTMVQKPAQFESLPGSDEAPPVVRAEGLMDTSEDPLKG